MYIYIRLEGYRLAGSWRGTLPYLTGPRAAEPKT